MMRKSLTARRVSMHTEPTHLLTIAPDRQIAVDETGDPHGYPVFFFHGWPASRLQGAGFSVEAPELGLRILSPDRPGIGLSTPQPGRRLLDWPPVVREIARQLGFERFSVMAVSGGGPYALATAFALPECVEATVVTSGAPPLGPGSDMQGLLPVYRLLLEGYRRWPAVIGHCFHLARPIAAIRPPDWSWPIIRRLAPRGDRHALQNPRTIASSLDCYCEAWRTTGRGVYQDAEVYAHDWGFALEEIRGPVRIWHGKADSSFPWRMAEALARRLPNCETRFVEGEGHYSLPLTRRREIMEDLIAARDAGERSE
jgi:pimeloyl-ACP methyl ester carboxylesterase